jgi:hypothetical protein
MTSSLATPRRSSTATRTVLGLLAAAVVAVLGNALIALLVSTLAPGGVEKGLQVPEYATMTVVGVLVGTAGWVLVRRFARRPRAALRVLVPVAFVLSLVPDLALLAGGTSVANVAGLMLMHVVLVGVLVPVLARVLPLPR